MQRPHLIPRFKVWTESQSSFVECLRQEDLESIRSERLALLNQPEQLSLFGTENGFIAWRLDQISYDNGDSLAVYLGHQGPEQELPALIRASSEDLTGRTLVVEVPVESISTAEILYENGFTKQRYRLTRVPTEHNLDTPRQGQFELRLGGELDRLFLCSLAGDNAVYTMPPGYQDNLEQYTKSIMERLRVLDYSTESDYDLLIAQDKSSGKSVGYGLLRATSEDVVVLEDIGIRKSYWGRYVAQFIIRSIENLLIAHNFNFLVIEISAANRRSYLTARKSLGFKPKTELLMLKKT